MYYDAQSGLLDRRAFASEAVFRREAETVFAGAWLFAGLAAWVDEPGAFLTTYIGADPAVLWRAPSGRLLAFANQCPAGVKPLATEDRGEAWAFRCPCHGHVYDEDVVARFATYGAVRVHRGLVFVAGGDAAGTFEDFVGSYRLYLDALAPGEGGPSILADAPLCWRVKANWKVIVESWCGACASEEGGELYEATDAFQIAAGPGVAILASTSGPECDRDDPLQGMTGRGGVFFPNLVFEPAVRAMHVVHPLAPSLSEIRTYGVADPQEALEIATARHRALGLRFTPGADGYPIAAWEAVSRSAGGPLAARAKLNVAAGLGAERPMNLPGLRAELHSEAGARAFYGWWQARLGSAQAQRRRSVSLFSPGVRPRPSIPQCEVP